MAPERRRAAGVGWPREASRRFTLPWPSHFALAQVRDAKHLPSAGVLPGLAIGVGLDADDAASGST